MSEQFVVLPEAQFRSAWLDAAMTEPNVASGATPLLLDPAIYDVRLGGDAGITGSDRVITVPLTKVIVTIGLPYGTEQAYCGDITTKDCEISIPFTCWANTAGDLDDFQQRAFFARDSRQYVFSSYGLLECGETVRNRRRPYSPVDGLVVADYVWRFRWSRP